MPYLQNEKTRTQAEIQTIDAEVASLTAQAQAQQQTLAQIQAQLSAARNSLAGLQAQLPALQTAASAADQRVADLDSQISAHEQTEPDEFIERPNKPPLRNPEWTKWKKRLDELTGQRAEAEAGATTAHNKVNDLNRAISQAAADVQSAETQAAQAVATLAQLNQATSTAREQAAAARQKLDELTRWSDEIDRDPMDRSALEKVAAGLSARVIELEDAWTAAEAASEAADATLASLIARRDELTAALTDLNSQMPAADAEVQAAEIAVGDLAAQLDNHITGGP